MVRRECVWCGRWASVWRDQADQCLVWTGERGVLSPSTGWTRERGSVCRVNSEDEEERKGGRL